MTSGILVIDKPSGITSHDVVNAVRRLARTRRVGHAGTLDPMATGVLVLLIGPATRLSRFVMHGIKRYQGIVRLGETTTTYDAEGETLTQAPVTVDRSMIDAILPAFTGELQQIPPMYAAIKVKGRKLYELAREGEQVERPPRHVTIHSIEILNWATPDLELDVVCSPGTYIRSLAHDMGQQLGCGAHLHALRRISSGSFSLDRAYSLAELERLYETGNIDDALLPPQAALGSMPAVTLTPKQELAVRYGQSIPLDIGSNAPQVQGHSSTGHLVAVMTTTVDGTYHPDLVFPEPQSK